MNFRVMLLIYLILFLVGSMGGYVLELLYRRLTTKRWVNPGFNRGPWLPLYGFGVLLMFSISFVMYTLIPQTKALYNPFGNLFYRSQVFGPQLVDIVVIGVMSCAVIALEFITGIIFVNGFKVRLWDYTNMKGNIKGVICPAFNIIWIFVCTVYYYVLNPFVFMCFTTLSDLFNLQTNISAISEFFFVFIVGIIYGVFIVDFIASSGFFIKVVKFTKNNPVAIAYERLRNEAKEYAHDANLFLSKFVPEIVKLKIENNKKRMGQKIEKTENWFKNLLYIDPNRVVAEDEYDENGRPAKFE